MSKDRLELWGSRASDDWLLRESPFMMRHSVALPVVPFKLGLKPSAAEIRPLCEGGIQSEAVLLFSFGNATASHRINDIWTACCEIYLQAQLVRQTRLHSFCLSGEQLFKMTYVDDAAVCSWSPEHVFAVSQREIVSSFETLVEHVLDGMSDFRLNEFVSLGASLMQTESRFATLREPDGRH